MGGGAETRPFRGLDPAGQDDHAAGLQRDGRLHRLLPGRARRRTARSREALERGAADLEVRVERRTEQLFDANRRLAGQITERRPRPRPGSAAASISWPRRTRWPGSARGNGTSRAARSPGPRRCSGSTGREPGRVPVTFERAMTFVHKDETARGSARGRRGADRRRRDDAPDIEHRIVLADGAVRTLHAQSKLSLAPDGKPVRMLGIVQDVAETSRFEREHRIADTLQQALLYPASFPEVEGAEVAARYVPAETGLAAGGDWFDVIPLAGGRVALVMGDVAGHGLEAASLMGRLRLAVRAYALEGHPPGVIAELTDSLLRDVAEDEMAALPACGARRRDAQRRRGRGRDARSRSRPGARGCSRRVVAAPWDGAEALPGVHRGVGAGGQRPAVHGRAHRTPGPADRRGHRPAVLRSRRGERGGRDRPDL